MLEKGDNKKQAQCTSSDLCHVDCSRLNLKYYTSPLSASALFLDQSDLSIPLNSQSQVVRTRMAAVCSTLVADVDSFVRKYFADFNYLLVNVPFLHIENFALLFV